MKIETVETKSFSMDHFRFGRGEKDLVILPGLSVQSVMGSAELVAGAYDQMAEDFTIYVFDRRKDLPARYTVEDMAEDTAEAFKELGLKKVNLFGASQGGMMSMLIAARHPELVVRLVTASTSVFLSEDDFKIFDEWIGLAEQGDAEALYVAFGEKLYPEEVFRQARDLYIEAAGTVTRDELEKFIILTEGMRNFDMTDELKRIDCPMLAVGDRDDRVLGAKATENIALKMKEKPGFETYMYEGYGHALYDVAPDFQKIMMEFLLR